jgi:hypothetical protein
VPDDAKSADPSAGRVLLAGDNVARIFRTSESTAALAADRLTGNIP